MFVVLLVIRLLVVGLLVIGFLVVARLLVVFLVFFATEHLTTLLAVISVAGYFNRVLRTFLVAIRS